MVKKRLLLTGVFKPYGVKDGYAEDIGMQMELFNNQITCEQGVHSPRKSYLSFGLYMMAKNISVPTTVLDFPSWRDFKKELKKNYTHVGISFIVANVLKAKRMVEYIREHHPKTKIILGGYGTMIPDLKEIAPHDEICHGEGVRWLREYFGEDTGRPIKQPIVDPSVNGHIYGSKIDPKDTINIFPGLGCKNGCSFCATSHKFNTTYIPFIKTGAEMFAACHEAEKNAGVQMFGIIDENLFKEPERAKELLAEMEKHKKPYIFGTFASAETVTELGVDFLVRLGVDTLWIGMESKRSIFNKTKGIDHKKLIAELRSKGIKVIVSSILFLEHHDKKSLKEDIDWAIELEADMQQFMEFTPYPCTPLYKMYEKQGRMIKDFPYPKLHGMDDLAFKHPYFKSNETKKYITHAFKKKYETDGPAVLNTAITAVMGYKQAKKDFKTRKKAGLCWNSKTLKYEKTNNLKQDKFMELRIETLRKRALEIRPILLASKIFAPNRASQTLSQRKSLVGRTIALRNC
jgi:biotin synthase-like enzyme